MTTPTDTPLSDALCTKHDQELNALLSGSNYFGAITGRQQNELRKHARSLERQLTAATARAERAEKLLREWINTELDSQDEEFEPWIESFTNRINAALSGEAHG